MSKSYPIAIIGNGCAAIHAIKELRENNYRGRICLFSDDIGPVYNPMLTTYYISGKIPLENCYPYGIGFDVYKKYEVELYFGSPVVNIDAENQEIETENGLKSQYSKCLIATGASSFLPPITGLESRNVFTCRTMDDAISLKKALERNPQKAVVVGASMTGIKIVELFSEFGLEVCLADQADQVFPLSAHVDCAQIIERYLDQKGIKLRLGAAIQGIEDIAGHRSMVHFSDRQEPEVADIIVISIGVRSNIGFLDPDQVHIDSGVIVNDNMLSNAPNLYAAGDVSQGTNLLNGKKEVIGLFSNACYQGRTAGRNMAGVSDVWPGNIPHNISHFWDMDFVSIGNINTRGEAFTIFDPGTRFYFRLIKIDEKLVGINLLNCFTTSGMLKQLMLKELVNDSFFRGSNISRVISWDKLIKLGNMNFNTINMGG